MVENDVKQEILKLYYEEHKRSVDIAPIINKSPQYASKVIKKIHDMKVRKNKYIINLWKRRKFIIKSIIKIILEIVKKKKNENYIMHYLQW